MVGDKVGDRVWHGSGVAYGMRIELLGMMRRDYRPPVIKALMSRLGYQDRTTIPSSLLFPGPSLTLDVLGSIMVRTTTLM